MVKTFLVGYTVPNVAGLADYLSHIDACEFLDCVDKVDAQMLCSIYAKLCYASLKLGLNDNITKTRGIKENLAAVIASGHGSVLEHGVCNFVTTGCSRVFTHELVRHRVGTAFSQTSGRYVRTDHLDLVLDDPVLDLKIDYSVDGEKHDSSVREILKYLGNELSLDYNKIVGAIDWSVLSFSEKKKLTSALRRILPNGAANEIGWSANFRALRHMITMRTSRHAEWEIRLVFNQVYDLVIELFPNIFGDGTVEMVDGMKEIMYAKT